MTKKLCLTDAYLKQCAARVTGSTPDGVILDQTVFYASGGGQPGDTGAIEADGPRRSGDREGWWVSFRIQAPKSTDVTLRSSNGSLSVTGVTGAMRLRTSNGSIRLMDVGGDVEADTSNGSVNATLSGSSWDGAGLNVTTSNGSVRLTLPDGYNARLVAGTSNGSINVDFPITVRGRIGRDIDTNLGSGGPALRLRTSNGSVRIQRR